MYESHDLLTRQGIRLWKSRTETNSELFKDIFNRKSAVWREEMGVEGDVNVMLKQ